MTGQTILGIILLILAWVGLYWISHEFYVKRQSNQFLQRKASRRVDMILTAVAVLVVWSILGPWLGVLGIIMGAAYVWRDFWKAVGAPFFSSHEQDQPPPVEVLHPGEVISMPENKDLFPDEFQRRNLLC